MTFNSPYYPELQYRSDDIAGVNQMIVGVSENVSGQDKLIYFPEASTFRISRKKEITGSEELQSIPDERSVVRVRTTVSLCTSSNWIKGGGAGAVPINEHSEMVHDLLFEDEGYRICASSYNEEMQK